MRHLVAASLVLALAPAGLGGEPPAGKGKAPAAPPAGKGAGEEAEPKPAPGGTRLTVADCVLIALLNNVELRRQKLADDQSELDRSSALAEFLPTLSASGGRHQTRKTGEADPRGRSGSVSLSGRTPWGTSLSGSASQSRDKDDGELSSSSTVSAELRQPLLEGRGPGSAFYGYRSAHRSRLASAEDLERQTQRTAFTIRQLYWGALKGELEVQANRRALKSADYFLKATKARLEAERASKLDVSNAEIQRSNREVALTSAEARLAGSLDSLKEAMDLSLTDNVVPSSPAEYKPAPRDGRKLLAQTLARRPDLRAARQRLEIKRLDLERKRRNAWPDLDLVIDYTLTGSGESTDESHDYDSRRTSVGLELSVPLGLVKRRNELRKSELELRRESLSLHKKEVSVEKELRAVLRDLVAAERNLASFAKRVSAARLAAAAARALYERGRASSFDVVRAEDDLLSAELGLARSRADCLTLQAELDLVAGRPVSELPGAPPAPAKAGGGRKGR